MSQHTMRALGSGDDGIYMDFQRGDVGCGRAGVAGVFNEVATYGESSAFLFLFMRLELTNKFSIGDGTAARDIGFSNELDGVGATDAGADALSKAAKFVGGGVPPGALVPCVGDELPVLESAAGGFIVDTIGEMV